MRSGIGVAPDLAYDLLERFRVYPYPAVKGIVQGADHAKDEGDEHRQPRHRHGMQPNAFHPEEVGKRYGEYSSHDEHHPQDVGYVVL
jgi:hypothetical protein